MNRLSLARANLGRNKRRTVLTILSVAVALFLFGALRSVLTTLSAAEEVASETRLITRNAISIVFPLPQSYFERLRAMEGVREASWANWFGGIYIDEKNFFGQFAVDGERYLHLYPEMKIPADQREAFLAERAACVVGEQLIQRFGWSLGQDVTLRGTIYPGEWTFTIRAVYSTDNPSFGEENMLFHYDYLYEALPEQVSPNWYVLGLADPDDGARVSAAVDDMFRNSSASTRTETERAFQAGFITMYGNIQFLLSVIGMAVFFAVLLVAGNTMMMSARERTNEVGVLKTLGFTDRWVFALVMGESLFIALLGGGIGLLLTKGLVTAIGPRGGGFLPGFALAQSTVVLGIGMSVLLGTLSGLLPAWGASRLPVIQALRRLE